MPNEFDCYYQWLGIPPDEQPPDHYRLLGLRRFEDNADVIATAADRQMAHVQRYKIGAHANLSQRLLNELSSAKLCLLRVEKKTQYDQKLRDSVEPPAATTSEVLPAVKTLPVAPLAPLPVGTPISRPIPIAITESPFAAIVDQAKTISRLRSRPASKPNQGALIGLIAAAMGVVVIGVLWFVLSGNAPSTVRFAATDSQPEQKRANEAPLPAEPIRMQADVPPSPVAADTPELPATPHKEPVKQVIPRSNPIAVEKLLAAGGRVVFLREAVPVEVAKIEDIPPDGLATAISLLPPQLLNDAGAELASQLDDLESVNFDFSAITDAGLEKLMRLPKLSQLHLYRASVTDAGLKAIGGMKQLKRLQLASTRISNAGLAELARLEHLRWLGLGELPQISGAGLEHLVGVKTLTGLHLNVTGISDDDLKLLANWPQLAELSLFTTSVSDQGLPQLYVLKNLQTLEIGRTRVTDAGVNELQRQLPQCRISRIP